MPCLFILRHGETVANVAGRMQGGTDSPLTGRGQAQARRQGRILVQAGASGVPVISSPQGRAVTTARLALPLCPIATDPRLVEVGMGDWQGLTLDEIVARAPEVTAARASHPFLWKFEAPGGERLESMLARIDAFLAERREDAVIVTHGVTAQLLRGRLLGCDLAGMAALPDCQGVVFRVENGRERVLDLPI